MGNKKLIRSISVVAGLIMLLGLVSQATGMTNFAKRNVFSTNTFQDVSTDKWYFAEISSSYQFGLVTGQGDGIFNPNGKVTIAEAITFAARIHSIYHGKDPAIPPTDHAKWYSGYAEYAKQNGIVSSFDWEFDKPTSREVFALFLSRSLPDTEFSPINDGFASIPDFSASQYNFYAILKLFRAGIITGSDRYARFFPAENITRAEAAAILNRIVDPTQRKLFTPLACDLTFSLDAISMKMGSSHQIKFKYLNQANGSKITWQTNRQDIILVSDIGLIQANKNGEAAVWACNDAGEKISKDLIVQVGTSEQAEESNPGSTSNVILDKAISDKISSAIFKIEATACSLHRFPSKKSSFVCFTGRGFFIDSNGTAITNLHLIDTVTKAKITTVDGKTYTDISILGYDRLNDIAIIKVNNNGTAFPAATLHKTNDVEIGDKIYYFYNKFKNSYEINTDTILYNNTILPDGIRSSRYFQSVNKLPDDVTFQQIDGCPMINASGEVVGICSPKTKYCFAKSISNASMIDRFKPLTLTEFTNFIYKDIKLFGDMVLVFKNANTYEAPLNLKNGYSVKLDLKEDKSNYLKFQAPSSGMLYVSIVKKSSSQNGLVQTTATNPLAVSMWLTDKFNVIEQMQQINFLSNYMQIWLPEKGDYVFEVTVDSSNMFYERVIGENTLHWYFVS